MDSLWRCGYRKPGWKREKTKEPDGRLREAEDKEAVATAAEKHALDFLLLLVAVAFIPKSSTRDLKAFAQQIHKTTQEKNK